MLRLISVILFTILLDQSATTLAMTRKVAGTSGTAAAMNTNMSEVEAVVNALTADNLSAGSVSAVKLNADVVRTGYGVKQHTDGSLMVDPSDTNPCLEASDGGLRVIVDNTTIERTANGIGVKSGGLNTAIANLIYPVGIVVTLGVSTNPATLFGVGTWTAIAGKVIVGIDGTTEFLTLDQTGGEKTHILTTAEMPAHTHSDVALSGGSGLGNGGNSNVGTGTTGSTGGGGAHNNLQPYIVKYVWQRTA